MPKQRVPEEHTLVKGLIFCLIMLFANANSVPAQNPVASPNRQMKQARAKQDDEKRKQIVECFPEKVRKYLATFEQGNGFVGKKKGGVR